MKIQDEAKTVEPILPSWDTVKILSPKGMTFAAIGRIVFNKISNNWNVPHLHYLIRKLPEGYEAICLETQHVIIGGNLEDAAENLAWSISNTIGFIVNSSKDAEVIKTLCQPMLTHIMDGYWQVYRQMELILAENAQDIGHAADHKLEIDIKQDIYDRFTEKINSLTFSDEDKHSLIDEFGKIVNKPLSRMNIHTIVREVNELETISDEEKILLERYIEDLQKDIKTKNHTAKIIKKASFSYQKVSHKISA